MEISEIEIIDNTCFSIDRVSCEIDQFTVSIPEIFRGFLHSFGIGIDPGSKNFGIALVYPQLGRGYGRATLFQCKLERSPSSIQRMLDVQSVLDEMISIYNIQYAVIEGASYGNRYGQVELAEARAAFALWAVDKNITTDIVPPKKIRKKIFGDGNIKNPWKNLPNDCAAAFAAGLYASVTI